MHPQVHATCHASAWNLGVSTLFESWRHSPGRPSCWTPIFTQCLNRKRRLKAHYTACPNCIQCHAATSTVFHALHAVVRLWAWWCWKRKSSSPERTPSTTQSIWLHRTFTAKLEVLGHWTIDIVIRKIHGRCTSRRGECILTFFYGQK